MSGLDSLYVVRFQCIFASFAEMGTRMMSQNSKFRDKNTPHCA